MASVVIDVKRPPRWWCEREISKQTRNCINLTLIEMFVFRFSFLRYYSINSLEFQIETTFANTIEKLKTSANVDKLMNQIDNSITKYPSRCFTDVALL